MVKFAPNFFKGLTGAISEDIKDKRKRKRDLLQNIQFHYAKTFPTAQAKASRQRKLAREYAELGKQHNIPRQLMNGNLQKHGGNLQKATAGLLDIATLLKSEGMPEAFSGGREGDYDWTVEEYSQSFFQNEAAPLTEEKMRQLEPIAKQYGVSVEEANRILTNAQSGPSSPGGESWGLPSQADTQYRTKLYTFRVGNPETGEVRDEDMTAFQAEQLRATNPYVYRVSGVLNPTKQQDIRMLMERDKVNTSSRPEVNSPLSNLTEDQRKIVESYWEQEDLPSYYKTPKGIQAILDYEARQSRNKKARDAEN